MSAHRAVQKNYILIWHNLEVSQITTLTHLFVVQDAVPFGRIVQAIFLTLISREVQLIADTMV